ncbi:MAG: hypothetical protein IPO45_02045 [Saprospiraceae bacterium]|nr:hypothetical protein [Candidatus Brachybacter algidus]
MIHFLNGGKDVYVKASILLPSKYNENKTLAYPIDYNVAGYGGRYDRINRLTKSKRSMYWWTSADASDHLWSCFDGEGPFGDSYQMDSDNSGAYGYSLIHELIPLLNPNIEIQIAATRFVEGCFTGGWVSLALVYIILKCLMAAFLIALMRLNLKIISL